MSMLSAQSDELRKMAAAMSERGSAIGLDYRMGRELVDAARMMREAADTIESLRDKLQGVIGTRYCELFGTPERAAWTLAKACGECDENFPCCECPLSPIIGRNVYEPEILEWLSGDAE